MLVTADFNGMKPLMNDNMKDTRADRPGRRAFFAKVLATVGGGVLGGSLLRGLLAARKRDSDREKPVNIATHPLAVPRTKEGSKSNV